MCYNVRNAATPHRRNDKGDAMRETCAQRRDHHRVWLWVLGAVAPLAVVIIWLWWRWQEHALWLKGDAREKRGQLDQSIVIPLEPEPHDSAHDTSRMVTMDGDDLARIEGIGPKIAALLNQQGILRYADLAESPVEALRATLDEAGLHFAAPDTWPQQASLAKYGRWEELDALQIDLKGGRRV